LEYSGTKKKGTGKEAMCIKVLQKRKKYDLGPHARFRMK